MKNKIGFDKVLYFVRHLQFLLGVSFYSWLIFENIPDENFARKLSKKKPNQPIDQSFISIIVLCNSVLLLGTQNKANK